MDTINDPINRSTDHSTMENVVMNNLLDFLFNQYDKLDRDELFSRLRECYTLKDALCAKDILIEECRKLDLTESITNSRKRRNNPNGDGHSRVVHDILDIWKVIDVKKVGITISKFVSSHPSKTDESNIKVKDLISFRTC